MPAVLKKELLKWLKDDIINAIFDCSRESPIHIVPKKMGNIVENNEEEE